MQPPQPSKGGLSNTHNLEAKISANTYAPLIAFKKPPLGDLGGWIIKPGAQAVVRLMIGLVLMKTCDPASFRIKSNLYFYLKHTMETLMIKVKSDKARRLIQDLEELDILEVIEASLIQKKITSLNVSDLKNKISLPMNEDAINEQIEKIRNEWQPNI